MKAYSFGTDMDGEYFFRYNQTNRCIRLECYGLFKLISDSKGWGVVAAEMENDARTNVGWIWDDAIRTSERGYCILGHCDTPIEVIHKVKLLKEYL